jgi:hypothetical protein
MPLIADAHVHLYDLFDPARFFQNALDNLATLAGPDDQRALLLTEAAGCHAFARLKAGTFPLPDEISVDNTAEEESLRITCGERSLLLIAGRQIVTRERVELLGLTSDAAPEDGCAAADAVQQLLDRGAIPVLAWAPGKWMFSRAKVVHSLCGRFPETLWLGDSRMRPAGWPTPAPMRTCALPVLAGSDPLPVPGEEAECGRYGIRVPGDVDPERPAAFLREALRNPDVTRVGKRNTAPGMLRRFIAHHRAKSA